MSIYIYMYIYIYIYIRGQRNLYQLDSKRNFQVNGFYSRNACLKYISQQRIYRNLYVWLYKVKQRASQAQDRNNKYFSLYIEFCINNKI